MDEQHQQQRPTPQPYEPHEPPVESGGTPVGRRVVLGMLGLGALGVAMGGAISSVVGKVAEKDPTGISSLLPGGGGFRYYSVTGAVDDVALPDYRLAVTPKVGGAKVTLSHADLAALPQTRLTKDVQCVTGWRVPAVRWTGVLLSDVLEHTGADLSAPAVSFGSFDGTYTESLTMEQALRPDVLVATHLDDAPITNAHGGPVRLYVAPMYFYKSLKWLGSISVASEVVPGYWEQLGYDTDAWVGQSNGGKEAPIV